MTLLNSSKNKYETNVHYYVGDRCLLDEDNVYDVQTLIVNIHAPIMNGLDFFHMFEFLIF